jgi:NAD(P)-dependent dehydrogenase (short-subunit alcohol dehydrogenase family)
MSGREGHVALVTGAGTGIGKATACLLAERGMHVAVVGRRRELLEQTARTIEATGCSALVLPGDLGDPKLPQQLVQDTLQALGRLDVLVNNAAITGGMPQEPTRVDPATMRAVVETNVIGVIRVTNAMLPLLRRSASPRIVNMSSSVGSLTLQTGGGDTGPIAAAYSPSKSFLNAVTIQYAKELQDTNILINAACPGFVATDLNGFRGVRTPEQGAAIAIRLASLPDDGPSGGFYDEAGVVPW